MKFCQQAMNAMTQNMFVRKHYQHCHRSLDGSLKILGSQIKTSDCRIHGELQCQAALRHHAAVCKVVANSSWQVQCAFLPLTVRHPLLCPPKTRTITECLDAWKYIDKNKYTNLFKTERLRVPRDIDKPTAIWKKQRSPH